MALKRFTNGITDIPSTNPMAQLPRLDPRNWVVYCEHFMGPLFDTATVANTTVTAQGYTVVASANTTVSLTTDAAAPAGCFKVVTTAADNEHCQLTTTSPAWIMTANKKFLMEAYFEITHTAGNIAQNELFIGLASNQATTDFFAADGSARTFDDGIGWYSPDADTDIDLICGEADVFDNVTVIATYATATWYKVSLYYDGADIYTWVNGTHTGYLTPAQIPISVTGPAIYFKSGEAAVHQLLVDYLLIAREV